MSGSKAFKIHQHNIECFEDYIQIVIFPQRENCLRWEFESIEDINIYLLPAPEVQAIPLEEKVKRQSQGKRQWFLMFDEKD